MQPHLEYHFSYAISALKLRQKHVVSGPLDYDTAAELRMLGDHLFPKLDHVEWPAWAWPGGYPLFYVTADSGVLCPKCANANIELTVPRDSEADWRIVAQDINYEDEDLYCDHCSARIQAAYGERDGD